MMRALGFQKNHVVVYIVIQAFCFALPGLKIGLLIALLLSDAFRETVYVSNNMVGEYGLSLSTVVPAVLMGLLMPLVANIGPVRNALSKNLRSSLDASRSNS